MKSKQILSFEQMHHLQKLGLELDYDTLYLYVKFEDTDWLLKPFPDLNIIGISCKYIPAYTLQDVLDVLPCAIGWKDLILEKTAFGWKVMYRECDCIPTIEYENRELIDAAYEMLVWCIKQGYVETNKNE